MPIVAREHFNRWYSKKAYYFALTFADLPLQFVCVLVYVLITYVMTAQPLEIFRLSLFFTISVMVTLISQGFGMIIGATCGVKVDMSVSIISILNLIVKSLFSFSVGCNHWSICDRTVCGVFWIFPAFGRCPKLLEMGVPHIIPKIWARRKLSCDIRLQSTKTRMQWHLLPL